MELNEKGYLDAGLHMSSMQELKEVFVKQFTTSQTREEIYNNFLEWKTELEKKYRIYEIWVDGSFATNKINPNDIDIVVFAYLENNQELFHQWNSIRNKDKIDAYLTIAVCEENKKILTPKLFYEMVNQRNYWRGQFGFDRNDLPKGIIVLNSNQENLITQGGDTLCQ